MNSKYTPILVLILLCLVYSCKKIVTIKSQETSIPRRGGPPNIIFLLADDMGYEMPTFDGGQSYDTRHLDSLAANGMVFSQCRATPLCSPSRVEMLSGLYSFRNYTQLGWGYYDTHYTTFVKMLQNSGYKTCVAGKWQLQGDSATFANVGFDNYCVWNGGFLYKNPALIEAGGLLPIAFVKDKYSEDITGDYAFNFIDQNKSKPFFIYYSFMLIHRPDQPTPLDPAYQTFDESLSDTSYIPSMTHYLDLKVGALINKLKADGLDKNTIIVFSGDNGSQGNFHSLFKGKKIAGQKGLTTELGTHVPLFVYWPGHITPGTNDNLVDYSDLAPTFLDMANVSKPTGLDGISFYPQLFGDNSNARSWTYCYYDPFPQPTTSYLPYGSITPPNSYAQDSSYKLYKAGWRHGLMYHFTQDPEEKHPLRDKDLTPAEALIKQKLQAALTNLQ